jgi:hypothetical protein
MVRRDALKIFGLLPGYSQQRPEPQARPRLGMNLAGITDWGTEAPFVDLFRSARRWISQRKGEAWGKGPELAIDDAGWVKRLEPDCWAETVLGNSFPSGEYTVLYEGEGKLAPWGQSVGAAVSETPGRFVLKLDSTKGPFHLQLRATSAGNPVRNIRVVAPEFLQSYETNPWRSSFLDRWKGVSCLRFMDWMQSNGSRIATWNDRPRLSDSSWTPKGVPLEAMIDLCNRQSTDGWFCIPYLADDDYVRNFAKAVRTGLRPPLKAYIEYSNEVWNFSFPQSRYAGEQGVKLGIGPKERQWEAGWHYTARRSVEIFKIWENVFGDTNRLVRVLASQAANPYVSKQVLGFEDAYLHADALAIAPYVGFIVSPTREPKADDVAKWSVEKVLDYTEKQALPKAIEFIRAQKALANQFGLRLIAYEGGQHLVGLQQAVNNDELTQVLLAANAHPRMGEIYEPYLDAWSREGGDLFCHYSSVSRWGKFGSWGLLQFWDDDPAKSPKFMATMNWARKLK